MEDLIKIDSHKLMYHPERVVEWLKKGDCFPVYVEIGPVRGCNHDCVFCSVDWVRHNGKRKDIEKDVLSRTLEDMAKCDVKSIMFAGAGEPLLHKDIGFFTEVAKENGMDVAITTNGVLFDERKRDLCLPYLSWIKFSIDSGSPDNYAMIHKTRPNDFNRVIRNIEESVKFKKKNNLSTIIGGQFLVVPQNKGEAVKLAKILKDIGADNLNIKPYAKQILSENNLPITIQEYNSVEEGLDEFNSREFKIYFRRETAERNTRGITYNECYGSPFFCIIDATGDVIPCNLFHDNKNYSFGNINTKSFREIWHSKQREKVLKRINVQDCSIGCRLHTINEYLDRLKFPQSHDKFI